jgi:hypothetical protein
MAPETFVRDLRVGLRVLVKERSFCALAIVVIALGICGVTTMFSVVNGIMLRGFSFPNADRMMNVNFIDPSSATFFGVNGQIASMDYEEFLPAQTSFELMAAYLNGSTVNVTVDGHPRRHTGAYMTEDFLRILGVGAMPGRDLTAEDNEPGAAKVAIIGYGIWQRDFGGSSDIVGKAVRINGAPATIIGVMPRGFSFPTNEELWIPLYSEFPVRPRNDPRATAPAVLGLIRRGVSPDQAQAEFTTFARRFASAYPDTNKQFNAGLVEPLMDADYPMPESRKLFFDRLLRELGNSPEFERVALTSRLREEALRERERPRTAVPYRRRQHSAVRSMAHHRRRRRHGRAEAARGPAAGNARHRAAARSRQGGPEPAALFRRHAEAEPRRDGCRQPDHGGDVLDFRRGRGRARRGRHLRRHVVLGEPAHAGVRGAHGARRERRPHPGDGVEAGVAAGRAGAGARARTCRCRPVSGVRCRPSDFGLLRSSIPDPWALVLGRTANCRLPTAN